MGLVGRPVASVFYDHARKVTIYSRKFTIYRGSGKGHPQSPYQPDYVDAHFMYLFVELASQNRSYLCC